MPLRIAVVGAGYWSEECHVPGLRLAKEAEVVALVGRRKELALEQAKRLKIPRVYQDYQEMLEIEKPEAITISTPNNSHKEIALKAMQRGIHVFCEKPLALDAKEALDMVNGALESNVVNHVGFTFRFLQSTIKARKLIMEGLIGRIFQARLWAENDAGLFIRPPVWRDHKELAGSGQLGDMGSHLFDLYRYLTGDEFTSVYAHSQTINPERKKEGRKFLISVDDFNSLLFETKNQVSGIAVASRVTRGLGGSSIELFGSEGGLRVVYSRGLKDELWYAKKGEEFRMIGLDYIPGDFAMLHMMEVFVADIVKRKAISAALPATFFDGLKAQDVIDATLLSAYTASSTRVKQSAY